MDPFFIYHPGGAIAEKLYSEKDWWIDQIVEKPSATIELISKKYKFGGKTDFWDDYIFMLLISPSLTKICKLPDIRSAVNKYSELDHCLFFRYIRRDEDPVRFRRAFWNVNSFGKQLSLRLAKELRIPFIAHPNKGKLNQICVNFSPKNQHKIAFIFKGQFKLAHAEFLHEFLRGSVAFIPRVKITLILVDEDSSNLRNTGIDHVEIISLPKSSTFDKLNFYYVFEITKI